MTEFMFHWVYVIFCLPSAPDRTSGASEYISTSSGSGNFQGDCGGGFRYSSTEDLFTSQVQVAGGVTTPSESNLFLFCPKPRMVEDTAFDLRAATEQLIDRTQQLQSSTRGNNQVQYNNTSHAPRNKFGEWAI